MVSRSAIWMDVKGSLGLAKDNAGSSLAGSTSRALDSDIIREMGILSKTSAMSTSSSVVMVSVTSIRRCENDGRREDKMLISLSR